MNKLDLKKISKDILDNQIDSINKLEKSFDKNFESIIDFLGKIKGRIIITDGDVRRTIRNFKDPLELDVSKIMSSKPKVIDSKTLASDALKIMNDNKITQIIIVEKGSYLGMVHMHQILNSGI